MLLTQEELTRLREEAHKRGFDSGIEYQKKADPPPMAKALKKELEQLRSAARAYVAAQTSDAVPVRIAARERLLAALGPTPSTNSTTNQEHA